MVDLHVHSTCSDGTFTPEELVDYAMEKGLRAFALTDHDTVNGLDRAIRYAEGLRQTQEASPADAPAPQVPEVIPGIELSTEYQGKDIHMVGLITTNRILLITWRISSIPGRTATRKCAHSFENMALISPMKRFWQNSPVQLSPGRILQGICSPTAISRA